MESASKSNNILKRKSDVIIGPASKKRRCIMLEKNTAEKEQSKVMVSLPGTIDMNVRIFSFYVEEFHYISNER